MTRFIDRTNYYTPRCVRGFNLIEIMIVLAIIAIVAALAYPSYIDQVRKSKRAVAKNALLDAANRQEQYFFNSRAYTSNMSQLGYSSATVSFDDNSAPTTVNADKIYTVNATAVNSGSGACGVAPCFQLQAIPQNDQSGDACGIYTLTSGNARTPTNPECW